MEKQSSEQIYKIEEITDDEGNSEDRNVNSDLKGNGTCKTSSSGKSDFFGYTVLGS